MKERAEKSDFREPESPADRVLALETLIDAKGQKLPTPPVCHGYANGCGCPPCLLRSKQRTASLAAA